MRGGGVFTSIAQLDMVSRARSVVDVDAIAIAHVVAIDRAFDATTAVLESTAKMGGPADLGLAEQKRGPWLAL